MGFALPVQPIWQCSPRPPAKPSGWDPILHSDTSHTCPTSVHLCLCYSFSLEGPPFSPTNITEASRRSGSTFTFTKKVNFSYETLNTVSLHNANLLYNTLLSTDKPPNKYWPVSRCLLPWYWYWGGYFLPVGKERTMGLDLKPPAWLWLNYLTSFSLDFIHYKRPETSSSQG